MVLTYDQGILLVTERKEDVREARAYLGRLGFDRIGGFLCVGLKEWRTSGKPVESLGTLSVTELREMLKKNEILLLDVREPAEWDEGHIEGAQNIYVGNVGEKADELSREKPLAITCEWGGRGGLAASIVRKMGFTRVYNVLGGMKAWMERGYPVKTE
jgi:hydroxyacylglutathione hydrolase